MAENTDADLIKQAESQTSTPSTERTDEEKISQFDKWFRDAATNESAFLREAQTDEDFYNGKQWNPKDIDILTRENRPAITYNQIFPLINLTSGAHRQSKQDWKVFNRTGGSIQVAEILTAILKHIAGVQNGQNELNHTHLMGLIHGKAYIVPGVSYEEDQGNGQIYFEYVPCFDILVDPFGNRYDLADRDFYFRSNWMPKAKLERMFPDKYELIQNLKLLHHDQIDAGQDVETFTYQDVEYKQPKLENLEKYRLRVKECWWKEYERIHYLVEIKTNKVARLASDQVKRAKEGVKGNPDLRIVVRVMPSLHMSQYVGNVLLDQIDMPFGKITDLPIVQFSPYHIRNKAMGMITQLKEPQREHNKRLSQALHHLNQVSNSGYTADEDAVDDWNKFELDMAKPGFIKKIKSGKRFDRDVPAPLSQGHIVLSQLGVAAIKQISGVNADMLGEKTSETESGIAIQRRQQTGAMAMETPNDNFNMSRRLLGKKLVDMIQNTGSYSRDEVLRLVVDGKEQEFEINKKIDGTNRAIHDLTVGRYDVVIDSMPSTPTTRLANYYALIEAQKSGIPIPPTLLLEQADFPKKDQIEKAAKAQMEMAKKEKEMDRQEVAKDHEIRIMEIQTKAKIELAKIKANSENVETKVEGKIAENTLKAINDLLKLDAAGEPSNSKK